MANFTKIVEVHLFSYIPDTSPSIFLFIQYSMKLVRTPTAEEGSVYDLSPAPNKMSISSLKIMVLYSRIVSHQAIHMMPNWFRPLRLRPLLRKAFCKISVLKIICIISFYYLSKYLTYKRV